MGVKMKNLINLIIIPQTFRSGEKFPKADIYDIESEFLYTNNHNCFFMNIETFENIEIPIKKIGSKCKFLKKQVIVNIHFFNEEVIDIILPNHVNLKVSTCAPASKKESSSKSVKRAELETSLICNVPLFINVGDII